MDQGLKDVLQKVQNVRQNKLLVEKDGAVVENMIYQGKIKNIYLNKQHDLEISFEEQNCETDGKNHLTIPIQEQLREQREKNESVYIKIDMENEHQAKGIEEIIFKVSPSGKVEQHLVAPQNDSFNSSQAGGVEEQRTALGFHPKRTYKDQNNSDNEDYYFNHHSNL